MESAAMKTLQAPQVTAATLAQRARWPDGLASYYPRRKRRFVAA